MEPTRGAVRIDVVSDRILQAGYEHPTGPVADAYERRIREREERELSPLATRSYPAGRVHPESDCGLRTPFQRDRDRIVHSKAFRRLMHKTQVFVAPTGDHYRTRLTHTLEVTQVSRSVARALSLNEDLVEAIGLGHDLGHPPFGHIGEEALDRCLRERFGSSFLHHEHSLRVVDTLERDGHGLNLTLAVRDGIVSHSGRATEPATLEGKIVRLVDRVAYINHDIDDALRAGVITVADLPGEPIEVLGDTGPRRIDALVHDLVENSERAGDIVQGELIGGAMSELRSFMFDRVYLGPEATREHAKIDLVVRSLFHHYCAHPDEIADSIPSGDLERRVTDYLAGMTDRFCIRVFESLSIPVAFAP
jgi:dGTPase